MKARVNTGNSTESVFVGATSITSGVAGNVPAPLAGDQNKFLCGNGQWATVAASGGELVINGDEVQEVILKCAEFGVLGVIVLILLTRGITELNSLTQSQIVLADSINRLYKEVAVIDSRVSAIEGRLSAIETSLGEIKNFLQYRFLKPDVMDR